MKAEVTQEQFYKQMKELDLVVSMHGNWPYTSVWKHRHNHKIWGEIKLLGEHSPYVKKYFIYT